MAALILFANEDTTMELRDLFCADIDSMTPLQADMLSRDIVGALAKGGLTGTDRQVLIAKNVEARRRVLGNTTRDVRAEVLQHIRVAEARGDKRTAEILANSMVKSDVAASERERRAKEAAQAAERHWADERTEKGAQHERVLQRRIDERVHELSNIYGSSLTEDKRREIADKEAREKLASLG